MTDRAMVSRWLAGYEAAWRAPGTSQLRGMNTRVVVPGTVRVGDLAARASAPRRPH